MTPVPYLDAIRLARARGNAINAATAREIIDALTAYANALAASIRGLPDDRQLAARASLANVRKLTADLEARLALAIRNGVALSFDETLAVWARAAERDGSQIDEVPMAGFGAIRNPNLTSAQAFASARSTSTWRSLLRGHVANVRAEVSTIVRDALLDGMAPDRLARLLVPYVQGRDRPAELVRYTEAEPVTSRAAAYSMEHNATRLAFSETHNARREAEVAHFTADPAIALGKWTLSPNRGTQRTPDACDALAQLDWWGLGAGVFPLSRVPLSPHPWDRCELLPLTWTPALRALVATWSGFMQLDPTTVTLPGASLLTPIAVARIRVTLSQILNGSPVPRAA